MCNLKVYSVDEKETKWILKIGTLKLNHVLKAFVKFLRKKLFRISLRSYFNIFTIFHFDSLSDK